MRQSFGYAQDGIGRFKLAQVRLFVMKFFVFFATEGTENTELQEECRVR